MAWGKKKPPPPTKKEKKKATAAAQAKQDAKKDMKKEKFAPTPACNHSGPRNIIGPIKVGSRHKNEYYCGKGCGKHMGTYWYPE